MKITLQTYARELEQLWPGRIRWNCPLARFSTLKVGGPAEALLTGASQAGLSRLLPWLNSRGIAWQVIGRGSNILAPDDGISGVVILLSGGDLATIEVEEAGEGPAQVRAGAGCALAKLVGFCIGHGLAGLEFCSGIPGSVGGAVVMNAGGWGRSIGDVLSSVTLLRPDGTLATVAREELTFSYRRWEDHHGEVVVMAGFALARSEKASVKAACQGYLKERRARQPRRVASAGSFFKNPPGQFAGRLIEEAGLKGLTVGGAMVSPVHANFLVNTGTATAADLLALMAKVQAAVLARSGIRLEPEVHILKHPEEQP